jgi:hydrogenase expression/formation protein HypE
MKKMDNLSKVGKFSQELMDKIVYQRLGKKRKEVLAGPNHGLDNAVVQLNSSQVLVVTADPLSVIPELGLEDSAWISVHLLASDLSTCGLPPQFIMVNFSLPPHMKDEEFEAYWDAFHVECSKLGVSILGGHTGRYVGSDYTVIGGGVMMTVAPENRYLSSSMAKPGDSVIMTKGVAIASTGILARTFPETIKDAYGSTFLRRAQSYLSQFSVVKDALTAASVGLRQEGVTAMHDVTEGGLLGAIYELMQAAETGVEVDLAEVIVTEEAEQVCSLFGLDPYRALSEGTLIITVKPEKAQEVIGALKSAGIRAGVIGEVMDSKHGRWLKVDGKLQPLAKPSVDPYWMAYWKARQSGWE